MAEDQVPSWDDLPTEAPEEVPSWDELPAEPVEAKAEEPGLWDRITGWAESMTFKPGVTDKPIDFSKPEEAQAARDRATAQYMVKPITGMLGTIADVPGTLVVEPTLEALDIAASGIASTSARVGSSIFPTEGQSVWDAFKNPRIQQLARQEEGLPAGFDEAYKQAAEQGNWRMAKFLLREIAPTGHGLDEALPEEAWNSVRDFDKDLPDNRRLGPVLSSGAKLLTRIAGDPLMYTKVLSLVPKMKELGSTDEILRAAKESLYAPAQSVGAEIKAGDRALLQLKLPISGKSIMVHRGEWAADVIDSMAPFFNKFTAPFRPAMTLSGFKNADSYSYAHELGRAEAHISAENIAKRLQALPYADDPDVWKLGDAFKRYGNEEAALKVLGRDGSKFSPQQIDRAREAMKVQGQVEKEIAELYRAVDLNPPKYLAATPEEQAKIMKKLGESTEGVPNSVVLLEDGTEFDFAFDRARGFGRQRSEALAVKQSENEAKKMMRSSGLMTRPSHLNERAKLSNDLYAEMLAQQYGLKPQDVWGNFQKKIIDDYLEAANFTNDVRYVNTLKAKYGVRPGDLDEYLATAKERVRLGLASPEERAISRLKPENFAPIDSRVFNRRTGRTVTKEGVTEEGEDILNRTTTLFDQTLLYPEEVARRLNSSMRRPPSNIVASSAAYLQKTWSESVLTSFGRVGRQAFENTTKMFSLRVSPSTAFKETAQVLGAKPDKVTKISQYIPSLNETIWDLGDFYKSGGVGKFSDEMFKNPELMNPVQRGMTFLKEKIKESGGVGKWLLTGDNVKIYDVPGVMNNNIISRTLRGMGGAADTFTRKAYFRQLIKDGYSVDQAVRMVNSHLMDFSRNTDVARRVRYVSPFGNFMIKNMESLLGVVAQNPGAANMLNPYNGSLKRAIEEYSGWDPNTSIEVAQRNPFMSHPVLMWALRGSDKINEDDLLKSMVGDWLRTGMMGGKYIEVKGGDPSQPAFKQQLDAGMQMYLNLPTHITAATDILSMDKLGENLQGPWMTAMMIGLTGYDPFTKRMGEFDGTLMAEKDNFMRALQTANPAQYPKVYNLFANTLARYSDTFVKVMQEPLAGFVGDILKVKLGEDAYKKLKISDAALRDLVDFKTAGLGKISKADVSLVMQQNALLRKIEATDRHLKSKYNLAKMTKAQITDALREYNAAKKALEQNAKIFRDYKEQYSRLGGNISPEAWMELQGMFELQKEGEPEMSEVPFDSETPVDPDFSELPGEDEVDEDGNYREPQSAPIMGPGVGPSPVNPKAYRKPGASFDMQTGNELIDRASTVTKEKLFPLAGQGIQQQQDSLEVMPEINADEEMQTIPRDPASEVESTAFWPLEILNAADISTPQGKGQWLKGKEEYIKKKIAERFEDPEDQKAAWDIIKDEMRMKRMMMHNWEGPTQRDERGLPIGVQRGPAAARQFAETGMGGAPSGGGPLSAAGAAVGLGLAGSFIKDKVPEETTMGMGSQMSPAERRLYVMSPEQLADEPDSEAKDKILSLKGIENPSLRWKNMNTPATPHDSRILPGYTEILVGDSKGTEDIAHWPKEFAVDEDYYGRLIKEGFDESDARDMAAMPPAGHVRGFSPNPDTFLIFEAQKARKSDPDTEKRAIDKAIKYAREAGFKNVGVVDAVSAAQIQGHGNVEPWIQQRYDKSFVNHMGKTLKQSPSEKEWQFKASDRIKKDIEEDTAWVERMSKKYPNVRDEFGMFLWPKAMKYAEQGKLSDLESFGSGVTLQNLQDSGIDASEFREIWLRGQRKYKKHRGGTPKIKYRVFSLEGKKK